MAKQSLAVFGGYASRAQTTANGVTQVMDANTAQIGLASRTLPRGVVLRTYVSATVGEYGKGSNSLVQLITGPRRIRCSI